jgi:hypothetical protein
VTETDPESGQFRGQVAGGRARNIDGSTTELRRVLVFASDADVPASAVEAWADPDHPPAVDDFEGWADVSVSTRDRAAVVEGTTDTADAFEWGDSPERSSPSTTGTDG